jgi:hypothetical protein
MDDVQTFELVDRKEDLSIFAAIAIPLALAIMILLMATSPGSRNPHPWTDPISMTILLGSVALLEVTIFWQRNRFLASRILLSTENLAFTRGKRELWRIAWAEVESVTLRKYTLTVRSFDEAFFIKSTDGRVRVLPSKVRNFKRTKGFEHLENHFKRIGIKVRHERVPTWITV